MRCCLRIDPSMLSNMQIMMTNANFITKPNVRMKLTTITYNFIGFCNADIFYIISISNIVICKFR